MGVEGHGSDPIPGLPGFAGIDPELFQGIGQLSGTFIPLHPGEPLILGRGLVAVNDSDFIGIGFHRSFHKGGEK